MIGNRARRVSRSLVVAALAATACGTPPEEDGAAGASTAIVEPAPLDAVEGLGVRNVSSPAPGLITAAQLTEGQLDALAAMGYTRFISLRVPSEEGAGWEEAGRTAVERNAPSARVDTHFRRAHRALYAGAT